jgi:iron complex outermembrane receptor protein
MKRACHLVLGALVATPALSWAQEAQIPAQARERIEITGSNIRRVEGEGALPLQVITRAELDRDGVQSAQDIVDRISANQSFGGWTDAKGIGSTLMGFTAASLRGLGAQRTLVLLDGRRVAPYALSGGAGVDLSAIPVSAIERIEVLKDGASAIYGSDAIGGVINFILRRDFHGLDLGVHYLGTQHGGGNTWRANLAAGVGDLARDGYNFFITADHLHQDALRTADRESTRTAYLPALGVDQTSQNTFPANIAQSGGFAGVRNPTIPATGATPQSCRPPLSFPTIASPRQCRFDYAAVIDATPPSEKTNIIARFTSALRSGDQVFAELSAYRGFFESRISPTPVSSAFTYTPMTLPPSSPYYPAAFVASLGGDPTQPIDVRYRTVELGPRVDDLRSQLWRAIVGVQGLRWGWEYRASANYMMNRQVVSAVSGEISESAFGPLLRSGVVNPFGANSDEVLQQMRATQIIGRESDNRAGNISADFKMSREVLTLPSGPLAIALGMEARRESLEQVNAEFLYSGDEIGGVGALPSLTQVRRRVGSVFAEASVPLTSSIEGNVAMRGDRYNDFGTTFNPKGTLRWQASRDVLFRLSYGTGFRAPTLSDLFLPPYFGLINGSDPIRCPVTQSENDCNADFRVNAGGNPALKPERSRQLNAGIVLEPVAGLSMTLDYYRVEIRDLIDTLPADAALADYARWGASRVFRKPPDAAFPALPGPIDLILETQINIGTLRTSGVDLDVRARLVPGSYGRIVLAFTGTYVIDYRPGEFQELAPTGAGRRSAFDGAVSRWRHHASIDWSGGPWAATLSQTFQYGYREPDLTSCDQFRGNCTADRRVGSYSVWDVQVRYTGLRNITLALGARNAFDRAPPLTNQNGTFQVGIDPNYADPRGRMFFGSMRYAFK